MFSPPFIRSAPLGVEGASFAVPWKNLLLWGWSLRPFASCVAAQVLPWDLSRADVSSVAYSFIIGWV